MALNSKQQYCHNRSACTRLIEHKRWPCGRANNLHVVCLAGQRLPSIRDFIKNECPIRGIDGVFREQPKEATITSSVIVVDTDALVVPGDRRLFDVTEQQLERIIADQGQVLICCFESSTGSGGRKLASPKRGSWSCSATVAGLQRLPGSNRALVRVLVTDRVAVQAIDSGNSQFTKAQAATLRDRWAYFVRTAALEEYLTTDGTGQSTAGVEVTESVEQVQDAADELLQLLQQLADTVQSVIDSPVASVLQQALIDHEADDELQGLLAWCQLRGPVDHGQAMAGSASENSSNSKSMLADATLTEKAWRLSYAPYAARGVASALFSNSSNRLLQTSGGDDKSALEMTDLGLRLEAALDVSKLLRSNLAAQLAFNQL